MNLSVINPLNGKKATIKELKLDDFREISFLIENEDDLGLSHFFDSKISGEKVNSLMKLLLLMEAREKYVGDKISFTGEKGLVNLEMRFLIKALKEQMKSKFSSCKTPFIEVSFSYPEYLYHETDIQMVADCMIHMEVANKPFDLCGKTLYDKTEILDSLDVNITNEFFDKVTSLSESYKIFEAKAGLPDIDINLFDNSAFEFIKLIYGHYSYDDITEILFMLSKRIPDVQYLVSRTPRDIDLLIRLYQEEIEKLNSDNKS